MKTKISILALGLIVIITSISCNNIKKETKQETVTVKENITDSKKVAKLESSKVCFVNNQFMGTDQIPVQVDGKTYYGCCQGCVDKLKNNVNDVRFAVDPLTGEKVDKSNAFIVLKHQGGLDVLYFASEKNYLAFAKP